jgi:two-component system chemotaxis response regulator CheY
MRGLAAETNHPSEVLRPDGKPWRVLLVEQDAGLRQTCAAALSGRGFAVREATDGEEAWEDVLSGEYDVVVTEELVPKISGHALARQMRVAGLMQPVILISNRADVDIHTNDPWQRIDAFLAKPFTPGDLLENVTHVLHPTAPVCYTLVRWTAPWHG